MGGPDARTFLFRSDREPGKDCHTQQQPEPSEIRALGNLYVELETIKDLFVRSSLGIDYLLTNNTSFTPTWTEASYGEHDSRATANRIRSPTSMAENTITYKKDFHSKHHLEALAGYTAQLFHLRTISASSKII